MIKRYKAMSTLAVPQRVKLDDQEFQALLLGYFLGNSLDWRIYYALVYDVVLIGLAGAVVAELRKARAIPAYRALGREGRGSGEGPCR